MIVTEVNCASMKMHVLVDSKSDSQRLRDELSLSRIVGLSVKLLQMEGALGFVI